MTDLEEVFRPLIDDSRRYREPIEVIETRARARRSRSQRRHRAQYRFGAAFLVVAVIAAAVGIVHANDHTVRSAAATSIPAAPPTTPVSSNASTGWTAFDYGLARLSVPPGWTSVATCAPANGHALVFAFPRIDVTCQHSAGPIVTIAPIPTDGLHEPYHPNQHVNGFAYELVLPKCQSRSCPSAIVYVPALKVAISFIGVDDRRILNTLARSTYAQVTHHPFGPVPASWKPVTYGDFTLRVPPDWHTVDQSNRAMCDPDANTVYLGTKKHLGGSEVLRLCGATPATLATRAWLHIEPLPSHEPRLGARVAHHNGASFARDPVGAQVIHELYFVVVAGSAKVKVTLGLGADPAIAQGILGSLRPSRP